MKEQKETILNSMREAIDHNQLDKLWRLAVIDPSGFFSLLCTRYLYKKRMEKLYFHLSSFDPVKMDKFQRLMLARIENDLGTGLFRR
ncbi:hypothetical protein Dred_1811 [Desulforamulus reducens MI-1]|uniref:Uncharacterized protein n=1 Tax=Desulforamulus reducens (strain ATCC BAA-1160 / DSM 100696 / MI-1) TaxID=349161 RepID=A4J5I3_DESRM|nr:hypothetical protein [Desulforamulus reducens]ABO50336.1 hypothetical protein Dred_1811 [Desulforamulus reducens MI-1]